MTIDARTYILYILSNLFHIFYIFYRGWHEPTTVNQLAPAARMTRTNTVHMDFSWLKKNQSSGTGPHRLGVGSPRSGFPFCF